MTCTADLSMQPVEVAEAAVRPDASASRVEMLVASEAGRI